MTDDKKPGTWYLIKADSPEHAFNHQRQVLAGGFGCAEHGLCPRCPVQMIGAGPGQDAMSLLAAIPRPLQADRRQGG